MKPIATDEFARRARGEWFGAPDWVTGFATDSREVQWGDCFLAIRGERVDGHAFVEAARTLGAVGAWVERPVQGPHLLVSNLITALADFARSYRLEFEGPVVGITGSAGKTTTKQMVSAALAPLGRVLSTVGNRNTEVTAPLLWPDINEGDVQAVVIEMGMRGFGQIAHLADFSKPNIAIITNIGQSHLEMVGSREGIARAKRELFESLQAGDLAIAPREDDFLEFLRSYRAEPRLETFGYSPDADARIVDVRSEAWTQRATIDVGGTTVSVRLPAGKPLPLNAAASLLAAREAGVSLNDAAGALSQTEWPAMRMECREANGVLWVLDMYNAAPNSMSASLETVSAHAEGRLIMAVLGEMRELGDLSESAHRGVGRLAGQVADRIRTLDAPDSELRPTRWLREAALSQGCADVADGVSLAALREELESLPPGWIVLIKGSRAVELEAALPPGVIE